MEAHPPYLLPKGLHPSGLPLYGKGENWVLRDTLRLLPKGATPSGLPLSTPARAVIASRSEAIWGGAGHLGRGRSGGTSSIPPAKGVVPLWTPPVDTRSRCHCEPQRSNLGRCGAPGEGAVGRHTLRLLPKGWCPSGLPLSTPARAVIASRSEAIWGGAGHLGRGRSGGTSSIPPAKGAAPLWTPPWGGAPSPWPPSWKEGGREGRKFMEAHPPYLLPKGRCPSGLPLSTPARAVIASRSEAIWGGAGHLGRERSGGAPHNES